MILGVSVIIRSRSQRWDRLESENTGQMILLEKRIGSGKGRQLSSFNSGDQANSVAVIKLNASERQITSKAVRGMVVASQGLPERLNSLSSLCDFRLGSAEPES